jgi:acyl carrier protein
VKAIIVGHLGVDARELTPETLFRDDLGADSLDSFELLMAFEDEFDIEIPDEDAGTMCCVQDAIAYIKLHMAEGSTPQRLRLG